MAGPRSNGRVLVSGELVARTPLRVGAVRGEGDLDLVVLRDGSGRLLVPGDSIAGALRAWANHPSADETYQGLVRAVFGPTTAAEAGQRQDLAAGLLTVADAPFEAPVEVRSGVGIDRSTGAAAPGIFYGFEVVPRSTRIPLHLELELPTGAERATAARQLLGSMIVALVDGEIGLGGMRTRGLGSVELDPDSVRVVHLDYADRSAVLGALRGGTQTSTEWLGTHPSAGGRRRVRTTVSWEAHGAVLSKDPRDGMGIDTLPLMGSVGGNNLSAVLPGSSIKGVLRTHAEWLCRTVAGIEVNPSEDGNDFLEQIAGMRAVDLLFGSIKRQTGADVTATARNRRGALRVDDCFCSAPVPADVWKKVINAADDQAVARAIDGSPEAKSVLDPAVHVAIDRFTGGAAEGLLYSVLEVRAATWDPLVLSLDLDLLQIDSSTEEQNAAIGLLLALLKMLRSGMVRLGFGTMRGAGRMNVLAVDHDGSGFGVSPEQALDSLRRLCRTTMQEVS